MPDIQQIQQIGDLYMALHINKLLYSQSKITGEMYTDASRVFTERLQKLESKSTNPLQTPA
jgi:hypothetical protein